MMYVGSAIQQKPVLRINPTLGKSMNPGAIKIIWFERARRTGAVQRICIAPRSIPVEQEQDSVLSFEKRLRKVAQSKGLMKAVSDPNVHTVIRSKVKLPP